MIVVSSRRRAIAALVALLLALASLSVVRSAPAAATPLPTVRQIKVIGYSVRHQPIMAYHLGDPTSKVKAVLLGQMHGDEPAGTIVTSAVVHGPPIRGIDLWVIPTMNPDGNNAHTRGNAHGVDLNRNWPDHWTHLTGIYYSGPRVGSEPETKAMYAFLQAVKPTLMVSMHQPLNGVDTTDGGARNPAFARRLATGLGLRLTPFTCWSVCLGSMTGWLTNHQSGSAVTVEFPPVPVRSLLTTRAPKAIMAAFGGAYDSVTRHNPALHIDHATSTGSSVAISGWTFDPDNRGWSLGVSVYNGARRIVHGVANLPRPDVNKVYGLTRSHGFRLKFSAPNGTYRFCVAAGNYGYGNANPRLCKMVTVNGDPLGMLDTTTAQAVPHGSAPATLTGWAFDRDDKSVSSSVQVNEGSTVIGKYVADVARPDVNAAYKITGNHGFSIPITASPGVHTYTVYAVNLGSSKANALVVIGKKTVTVS